MHNLLTKLLDRRGIDTVNDLDKEEKANFDSWNVVLSKEELTVQDIKEFCETQVASIEAKWSDLEVKQAKKNEYIPYHTVYKALLRVLNAPQSAREQVEKQLNELLK